MLSVQLALPPELLPPMGVRKVIVPPPDNAIDALLKSMPPDVVKELASVKEELAATDQVEEPDGRASALPVRMTLTPELLTTTPAKVSAASRLTAKAPVMPVNSMVGLVVGKAVVVDVPCGEKFHDIG